MPRWTKLQNWTDRPNDWTIRRDGKPVGRVYDNGFDGGAGRWVWAVQSGECGMGFSQTLDEALEEVRKRGR